MFTGFYRLTGRPFQLSPHRRFFFASRAHRQAMSRLADGLAQAEGLMVVTGATGTGKTLLIDFLAAQLPEARFLVARLDTGPAGPGDALPKVARALGLDPALGIGDRDGGEALTRIRSFLAAQRRAGRRVLVVVDEGQSWSAEGLEELRLLIDLQADGWALAQVLLVGQPGLDDQLAAPALAPLRQRVVVHHRLGQLGADEVGPYIEHRLRCVGWQDDPRFTADAHQVIFAYTEGVARLINRLCSRLLVLGAIEHRHEIDAAAAADAIAEAELEHLSPPATAPGPRSDAAALAETAAHPTADSSAGPEPRAAPEPPSTGPSDPATGTAAGADESAAIDQWWAEVAGLQRQLERALGDLSGERSRAEAMRAEADRLRAELHRIELERLRLDAETSRRAVEALARATSPEDARLFRRFADEDA